MVLEILDLLKQLNTVFKSVLHDFSEFNRIAFKPNFKLMVSVSGDGDEILFELEISETPRAA